MSREPVKLLRNEKHLTLFKAFYLQQNGMKLREKNLHIRRGANFTFHGQKENCFTVGIQRRLIWAA